ncbi:MAG: hypothetical protein M3Q07_19000 [Pseudobdellovibrionaceae bacterium]|nr:hypothetical protein [Pseudobdellovibrionaceae bacterium]
MIQRVSAALILLGAMACGQQDSETSTPDSVVSTMSKWANPRSIPVCIINRSEISSELFNDIKSHVSNDYSSKVGIGLVGWSDCTTSDRSAQMIRVTFSRYHNWSGHSISAGGGLSMVGASRYSCGTRCQGGTMRIDVSRDGKYPGSGTWARDFAVKQTRATAVHEFGHALGLLHEHERTDAPGCGDYDEKVRNSDWNVYVGKFDSNSIMNYCHNNELTSLSHGDVAGLKYLYPSLNNSGSGERPTTTPTPRPTIVPRPTPTPQKVSTFGPFGHNQSKVLMTIPKSEGSRVSFALSVDVENHASCDFDHVVIEDATGWRSSQFCGRKSWTLNSLVTPIKVIFNSDPAVASNWVKVSNIVRSVTSSGDEPAESESPAVTEEAPE